MMKFVAFVTLAVVCATAAAGSYSCGIDPGTPFTENNCTLLAPSGTAPGDNVTIVLKGTVTKSVVAGTFKYQIYENYVPHFVASGNVPYFFCNNKGCDMNDPIALTLQNPGTIPTKYTGEIPLLIPQPQKTGLYQIAFWGEDQDHSPYDVSGTLALQQTCNTDADCPPGSYCMNGPGQVPPYLCH